MKGNFHVQFLGEGVAATSPPYPTPGWATTPVYPAQGTFSDVPFSLHHANAFLHTGKIKETWR